MAATVAALASWPTLASAAPAPVGAAIDSTLSPAAQLQRCQQQAVAQSKAEVSCNTATLVESKLPKLTVVDELKNSQARIGGGIPTRTANGISPDCALGQNPNRWTACTDQVWGVNNYVVVNGVPQWRGSMSIRVRSSVEFAEGDGDDWLLDTVLTVTDTQGSLQSGAPGTVWTGCLDHNDKCTTSELEGTNKEREAVSLTKGAVIPKTYTQYSAVTLNNQIISLDGNLGSAVEVRPATGNAVTLADHYRNTLYGRCDNVSPNRYGVGCVNWRSAALVTYDTRANPVVEPVAKHVFNALRNLPTHWGNPRQGPPLNRVTNEQTINDNRNAVCGKVTVPTGQSCDEYPLASSYQGGTYAAENDRSIAIVPLAANNSQGGLTSAAYDLYRVLDGNDFYVQAILADGTTAW